MLVLYVDDHPLNHSVMKGVMGILKFDLRVANNAFEGLDMIEQNKFDLVLMDLHMPGMDGVEAIKRIRAREDEKANVPIIVVTADTGHEAKVKSLEAGAQNFMLKPIGIKTMIDTISGVLPID